MKLFYVMGYFDQVMLNKLTPVAKQFKIISPATAIQTKKNKDALKRIQKAGADVRLHQMCDAKNILCPSKTNAHYWLRRCSNRMFRWGAFRCWNILQQC